MEFFNNAKTVRLKAHNNKFLLAGDDGEKVRQDRDGSGSRACWGVEFDTSKSYILLKNCFGRYLTASEEQDFHGFKVTQSLGSGNEIYWKPFKDGCKVYFKAYVGSYLRANGGVPPLRNTVSHAETETETETVDEQFQWVVEVLEFSHVNLPKIFTGNSMEEIRAVALAYYANCSNDYKARVVKAFNVADTDGNGSLSFDEFKAACELLECPVKEDHMFRFIDKDGSGSVNFEEAVTFYYMAMNRRLFCDGGCKQLLFMSYFSCVKCFCDKESGTEQFNLRVSCYGEKNYKHEHTEFLDNYTLLNHITPKNDPNKILEAISAFNKGWIVGTGIGHVAVFASSVGACSIM